jgi:MFS family permease
VRKNLSFAMPGMQDDLGITKASLGLFLTLHGLLYGVSRFVNGMWADRANARYFMVAGLMLSVGANVFFGFQLHRAAARRGVDDQRLGAGHGIPAVLPAHDALVPAGEARDEDVDLEHVAFDRRVGRGRNLSGDRGLLLAGAGSFSARRFSAPIAG